MGKEFNNSQPKSWYDGVADNLKATEPIPNELLIQLKDEAKKCFDSSTANYNIKNAKTSSDFQWMKTVMSKGAVSDKVAAHIVSIQNSPIHNFETLSNLVGMVKVGKKKECIVVIENLVELFVSTLLPPNRKLIPFKDRPLNTLNDLVSGNAITRKKYLATWYFEDQLKEVYTSFVLALNTVAHDTVDSNKEKAISAMFKLLAGHPEQEKNLLTYIVNKLGDPSRAVASKATYCLMSLLKQHSNMQEVVLIEIEKLLFRPNISSKAQYYALCFLTQFYLCHETANVARRLIEVYFSFFKACVKKGEVNSRMMSALLMGVNRAYPYAKLELDKISDHINTMYRVVHLANFNVGLHALTLLYQVSNNSDRFLCALYKKLFDPQICNTTHHAILLSLLYKSLSRDTQTDRVKVIIKRLLQQAAYMQPPVTCGILYVVSQLISKNPNLLSLILKPSEFYIKEENEDDNEEEKYVDVKTEDDIEEKDDKKEESTTHTNEDISLTDQEDDKSDKKVVAGWTHNVNSSNKTVIKYDGLGRNPLYSGGQFAVYAELNFLKQHFHPTVSLFANNILNGKTIQYSGDPLKDFSLIRFLDRFAFKNPKKPEQIAEKGYHSTFGKRKSYTPVGTRSLSVKSDSFIHQQESKIPVDVLFLYTFLQRRNRAKPKRDDDDDSDLESVGSEEFEDMLSKMTGADKNLDEDLDFMDDVQENLKSGKKRKNKDDDVNDILDPSKNDSDEDFDELGDDNDSIDDDEADENMLENMTEEDKELMELSDEGDDDASDIVFDSEDEDESPGKSKKGKKKNKNDNSASLFASAEEFASILEDEGGSKVAPGSSNAWSNKDNANTNQIAWEDKRNQWIKGYNSFMGKGNRKPNRNFKSNNKRKLPNKSNSHNKKKQRR